MVCMLKESIWELDKVCAYMIKLTLLMHGDMVWRSNRLVTALVLKFTREQWGAITLLTFPYLMVNT